MGVRTNIIEIVERIDGNDTVVVIETKTIPYINTSILKNLLIGNTNLVGIELCGGYDFYSLGQDDDICFDVEEINIDKILQNYFEPGNIPEKYKSLFSNDSYTTIGDLFNALLEVSSAGYISYFNIWRFNFVDKTSSFDELCHFLSNDHTLKKLLISECKIACDQLDALYYLLKITTTSNISHLSINICTVYDHVLEITSGEPVLDAWMTNDEFPDDEFPDDVIYDDDEFPDDVIYDDDEFPDDVIYGDVLDVECDEMDALCNQIDNSVVPFANKQLTKMIGLPNCSNITNISIVVTHCNKQNTIDEKYFEEIIGTENRIKCLKLENFTLVSAQTLKHLEKCPHLVKLSLCNMITDRNVTGLANVLGKLQYINIEEHELSDAGLTILVNSLQNNCSLKKLNISYPDTNDPYCIKLFLSKFIPQMIDNPLFSLLKILGWNLSNSIDEIIEIMGLPNITTLHLSLSFDVINEYRVIQAIIHSKLKKLTILDVDNMLDPNGPTGPINQPNQSNCAPGPNIIAEIIKHNTSIEKLYIEHDLSTKYPNVQSDILAALEENYVIKDLYYCCKNQEIDENVSNLLNRNINIKNSILFTKTKCIIDKQV